MRLSVFSLCFIVGVSSILLTASDARAAAPQHAAITAAAVNYSAIPAGHDAMLAVELDIKPGFHAQSHTPLEPNYKAFSLEMEKNPAVVFGDPQYPPGMTESYPNLGLLSVYTGKVIVRVPFKVKQDAPMGPLTITGTLSYQICDSNVCYLPEKTKFTIDSSVISAGETAQAVHPELFAASREAPAPATGSAPPAPAKPAQLFGHELGPDSYGFAFLAAFLVGIVFNVMPCVLPVVPLKALGFYEVSQHNRAKSVWLGAVFSAGLIVTFAVLGLLIFAFKKLEWGGLFTQTWFIIVIVVVLLLMAASTFGAFTVALPTSIYNLSPRHDTFTGNFLFGILTALLSTPCTFGMFVGLLAWAALQPASIGVLLMVAVGIGMASPYFVLSAVPELARRFPRSGPWAELVKQMMGFLLIGTAAYFAWGFIDKHLSPRAFWWILFGIVAVAAVFLLIRSLQFSRTWVGRTTGTVLAVAILVPSLWAVRILTIEPFQWQPYTAQAVDAAHRSGRVVLVEFTASWCGNCHWLEGFVFNNWRVVKSIKSHNVLMLRADVGDEGSPSRDLLLRYNKQGSIPLTVIYPPNSSSAIELIGIYSKDDLRNAIDQAAKGGITSVAIKETRYIR
jgi:thiol:disulfide interchange protein